MWGVVWAAVGIAAVQFQFGFALGKTCGERRRTERFDPRSLHQRMQYGINCSNH